ncbi:MAG: dTDP-glucose 4,6-dehydratase [Candidatus Eremiobacteraeota bacterium]|nr:dTDP-glucose 4,6-dehydratase [Candidatus Eremiobacteraeota bacterium]
MGFQNDLVGTVRGRKQAELGTPVWLVTGGAGFIGSHFVKLVLRERPEITVLNLDALTYAGNLENLAEIEGHPRYRFVHANICDASAVNGVFEECAISAIVNFAAESHVDRSILDPEEFLRTDILGTHVLLEAARRQQTNRFLQVSTDEVYGHVAHGASREDDPIAPRSPYAASKAGGDLQVLAHGTTYGTSVMITRGSNTYGPNQYPEKLIPLFVTNLIDDEPVPVYGDGLQIRDWLHVEDHARGILHVLEHGELMNVYNIGGGNARTNMEITKRLLDLCGRSKGTHIRHVLDRPGHDRRYALDASKAHSLGWRPRRDFEQGLEETAAWYREHESWWRPIKSGGCADYYRTQYAERGAR